jgi:hypothetical protein
MGISTLVTHKPPGLDAILICFLSLLSLDVFRHAYFSLMTSLDF